LAGLYISTEKSRRNTVEKKLRREKVQQKKKLSGEDEQW